MSFNVESLGRHGNIIIYKSWNIDHEKETYNSFAEKYSTWVGVLISTSILIMMGVYIYYILTVSDFVWILPTHL